MEPKETNLQNTGYKEPVREPYNPYSAQQAPVKQMPISRPDVEQQKIPRQPEQPKKNHMWKPILLIIAIVVVLAIILVITLTGTQTEEKTSTTTPTQTSITGTQEETTISGPKDPCPGLTGQERDNCLFTAAMTDTMPNFCYDIKTVEGDMGRDNCFYQIATSIPNPQYCYGMEKISGERSSDQCMKEVAQMIPDPSLCFEINATEGKNGADNCQEMMAEKLQDENLCDFIINQTKRIECFRMFDPEYEEKEEPKPTEVPHAITEEECKQLKKERPGEYTDEDCYLDLAIQNSDTAICERSDDQEFIDACKEAVIATS